MVCACVIARYLPIGASRDNRMIGSNVMLSALFVWCMISNCIHASGIAHRTVILILAHNLSIIRMTKKACRARQYGKRSSVPTTQCICNSVWQTYTLLHNLPESNAQFLVRSLWYAVTHHAVSIMRKDSTQYLEISL